MEVYFKDLSNPEELIEKRKELKKGEYLTLILNKDSFIKGTDLDYPDSSDIRISLKFIMYSDIVIYVKDDGNFLILKDRTTCLRKIRKPKIKRAFLKKEINLNNGVTLKIGTTGNIYEYVIDSLTRYFSFNNEYEFQIFEDEFQFIEY